MAIAGKVAITPGYEWSVDVAYDKLVVVTFENNVYLSTKPSTGIEPTNEEYWMLLIENVTAEDLAELQTTVENIINGTTQVGNADKLDGFHADDFQKTVAVNAGTNTLASLRNLVSDSGKARFVYLNGVPSDFPTNLGTPISSGWMSVEVNKVGVLAYYNINAVKPNGTPFNITGYCTAGTFYWNNNADGGNADTVDGKHASDFLPLTGGTLSGQINIDTGADGIAKFIGYGGTTYIRNSRTNGDYRDVVIDTGGLKYSETVSGKASAYNILHTGNSNAVVKASSAPSDTTAIWVDTTNKVSKIYVDGAWTALA